MEQAESPENPQGLQGRARGLPGGARVLAIGRHITWPWRCKRGRSNAATRMVLERTHNDDGGFERPPNCPRRRFRQELDAHITLFCHLPNDMGCGRCYPEQRKHGCDPEEANLDPTEDLALASSLGLPLPSRRWAR